MKWIPWVLLKIQSGHDFVHRQTEGRTDRRTRWYQYTPLQLRWSGGYNKSPLVKQCWQISMLPFVTGKIKKKCSSSPNIYHRTYKGTYGTSQKLYAKKARNHQYKKYFSGIGFPFIMIRMSWDSLISILRISYLIRQHLYIEMVPYRPLYYKWKNVILPVQEILLWRWRQS